jgi:hypothetical protein
MNPLKIIILLLFCLPALIGESFAQKPMRAGTTAANFLEIGFGAGANAMGDAAVTTTHDVAAAYWNPAGLANLQQNEAMFVIQPWLVDSKASFAAAGVVVPNLGTIALSYISLDFGEMAVTTLEMQEGTGETFSASDMAMGLSFGRKIVTWFSVGASAKMITSRIWHTKASAYAFDFGVIIDTPFFSPTGDERHGLNVGMSISNYGTRMKYDGMDLLNPIDISTSESGNYRDVPGQFKLNAWELPLIFRFGVAWTPYYSPQQELILSVDALHPNNNSESLNLGAQYSANFGTFGKLFLRSGYKALFMEDSEYGLALGGGVLMYLMQNRGLKIEYAFRNIGILGKTHCYGISVLF